MASGAFWSRSQVSPSPRHAGPCRASFDTACRKSPAAFASAPLISACVPCPAACGSRAGVGHLGVGRLGVGRPRVNEPRVGHLEVWRLEVWWPEVGRLEVGHLGVRPPGVAEVGVRRPGLRPPHVGGAQLRERRVERAEIADAAIHAGEVRAAPDLHVPRRICVRAALRFDAEASIADPGNARLAHLAARRRERALVDGAPDQPQA